jgi:hypothetical protein
MMVSGRHAFNLEMVKDFPTGFQGESQLPAKHGRKAFRRARPELAKQLVNVGCD